jgi:hypothetical protein
MRITDNETEQVGSSSNASDLLAIVYLNYRFELNSLGCSTWFFLCLYL